MSKRSRIEDLRSVMIARTDGLGDVIVTLPMAMTLKEHLPEAEVAFLVSPYTAPIVRRIAEVDHVFTVDAKGRGLRALRAYRPDAIVFAKPELRLALDAVLARIRVRIGTGYRFYSGLFTHWVYEHRKLGGKHEAQYGVNLLGPLLPGELDVRLPSLQVSAAGDEEARERLKDAGIDGDYMVMHPGSRGSAGAYPVARYAEVARAMMSEHPRLAVVVTAGPGEERLAGEVVAEAGDVGTIRAIGGITLDGLSELLRGARCFLGSSSGPAHLASLAGTPVVGLYPGLPPTWPVRWRPLGERVITLTPVPEESRCSGCGNGHEPENCVARIAPGRVVDALGAVLACPAPSVEPTA